MTTFFPADDGYHYPVRDIERFKLDHNSEGDPVMSVDLVKGNGRVNVVGRGADIILRAASTIVPAENGTFYVGITDDTEVKTVWFQPVIAWMIPPEQGPLPITVHGIEGAVVNRYVIRMPNGSIADYAMGDYANLADYLQLLEFGNAEVELAMQEEEQAVRRRLHLA